MTRSGRLWGWFPVRPRSALCSLWLPSSSDLMWLLSVLKPFCLLHGVLRPQLLMTPLKTYWGLGRCSFREAGIPFRSSRGGSPPPLESRDGTVITTMPLAAQAKFKPTTITQPPPRRLSESPQDSWLPLGKVTSISEHSRAPALASALSPCHGSG